jgi:hypothetical protein
MLTQVRPARQAPRRRARRRSPDRARTRPPAARSLGTRLAGPAPLDPAAPRATWRRRAPSQDGGGRCRSRRRAARCGGRRAAARRAGAAARRRCGAGDSRSRTRPRPAAAGWADGPAVAGAAAGTTRASAKGAHGPRARRRAAHAADGSARRLRWPSPRAPPRSPPARGGYDVARSGAGETGCGS